MLENNRFSKFFVCSLFLCCAFFRSRFALNFFFFGSSCAFFFNNKRNHIRLLIKTDERKEGKDFETFLSLFFPLFDTNTTTLALTQRQRRRTRAVFLFFFRVVKFYIEKDSKKRRAIDFDCFAHHPEAAAKNPKLTKKRLFSTHIYISLSLD